MPVDPKLNASEIAKRVRDKVADLNDELTLAALAEVDVEFVISYNRNEWEPTHVRVLCSQEV